MRNSDIDKVKAFASRDTDRARMAYDRTVTAARRQCVIIATTNNEKYLRDRTGNRRFWPVRVGRFDLDMLLRDRDQLWAEAAARAASGASIRLPETLWAAAAIEQAERVVENPFISVLDQTLRERVEIEPAVTDKKGNVIKNPVYGEGEHMQGKISSEDVWTILEVKPAQRTQDKNELLGDAMKQLGWMRERRRDGPGKRSYFYTRGNEPYRRIKVSAGSDGLPANAYYDDNQGQGIPF
jgi:predicted P-loop ATPase